MKTRLSIHDAIHGPMGLTEEEVQVIEHPYFQRLRRIKALGFLDRVFPSAKHSRFEHSIGACHVAGRLFDSLQEESKTLSVKSWSSSSSYVALDESDLTKIFSRDLRRFVRLAALLHDVGHGPFSHASEKIMPALSRLIEENETLPEYLKAGLEQSKKKKIEKGKGADPAADHEDYSLILAYTILSTLPHLSEEERRTILSLKSSLVKETSLADPSHLRLLGTLVDGEIDSDRMDYLLRDSKFCGVPYGNYDLKRLLEGLCVVKTRKGGEISLGVLRNALTAFEDFLFSRFQMHVQIYTHKMDASFNEAFKLLAQETKLLPAKIEKYVEYDDESMVHIHECGQDLRDLILNRKKWPMVIESYGGGDSNDAVLFDMLIQGLQKTEQVTYESQRPFKKDTLSALPVICEAFGDKLVAR